MFFSPPGGGGGQVSAAITLEPVIDRTLLRASVFIASLGATFQTQSYKPSSLHACCYKIKDLQQVCFTQNKNKSPCTGSFCFRKLSVIHSVMERQHMCQGCVKQDTSSIKVRDGHSVTPFSTELLTAMKVLLLVCVLASLLALTPRTEASQIPIKLCGREFLRAVVYTCGGSRWRRSLNDIFTKGQ